MHQSNPTAPSPLPRATAGNLPALSVPGVGRGQILRAPGSGICLSRGHPRAFDTNGVSYPKHGGFYWKHKQISRLVYLGPEKFAEDFRGMFFSIL